MRIPHTAQILGCKIPEIEMIKHQVRCNDCGLTYFLEDAEYCIHKATCGIGTKECPQCHSCICHGETTDQIQQRFKNNIEKGKFVKVDDFTKRVYPDWTYQCKTIKAIEV